MKFYVVACTSNKKKQPSFSEIEHSSCSAKTFESRTEAESFASYARETCGNIIAAMNENRGRKKWWRWPLDPVDIRVFVLDKALNFDNKFSNHPAQKVAMCWSVWPDW